MANTKQQWGTQQTKGLQAYLNKYGYTDDSGKALAVDGMAGPKTQQALIKFDVNQKQMNAPDAQTKEMQILLRDSGYKNADGTPLKVDGIHGPNTDNAINAFENDFLGQVVPNYTPKTVQTTMFPKVPNLSKVDTTPAPASTGTNLTDGWGQPMAYTGKSVLQQTQDEQYQTNYGTGAANANYVPNANGKVVQPEKQTMYSPYADPEAGQKNLDGTWKQIAKPGTWNGSGETILEAAIKAASPMEALYKPYAQATKNFKDMQSDMDVYKEQVKIFTQKAVEAAQKVRMGLAKPEDEYNGLQQQIKSYQAKVDAAQKLANKYKMDSDDLLKQMNELAATQKPAPQEGSGLFDTPEAAAEDFAKRAMPLTDKTSHEYAAVMTEVMVPEYKDGKMQMVPKYKYGDIMAGEIDNVVGTAALGLLAPTDGKKYLLHTHPDNDGYVQDYFSGLPYDISKPGDASIPTFAGSQWYQAPEFLNNILTNIEGMGNPIANAALQVLKNITGKQLSGYDGIYLASPNGFLTLYQGANGEYGQLWDSNQDKSKLQKNPVTGVEVPKTKGKWDHTIGEYKYKK